MKRPIFAVVAGLSVAAGAAYLAPRMVKLPGATAGGTVLPNGWKVSPAGAAVQLPGDMPLKGRMTRDGRYLLLLTAGYHDHSLNVIDTQTGQLGQTVDLKTAWAGLAIDPTGKKVYVSGGKTPIQIFDFADGKLTAAGTLVCDWIPEKNRHIADLAFDGAGRLWLTSLETNSVYRYDAGTATEIKVGYRPYALALSSDGKTLAVSNWGDESVSLIDPDKAEARTTVKVGSHPNEMVYGQDGRLFVANSGSNSVSVLRGEKVVETIKTSLDPKALVGSTPDALALAPNGKTLYVANADNNDLASIDVSDPKESRVAGFIPTGWYPSFVALDKTGKIYVGTAKGLRFSANPAGPKTKSIATSHDGKFKFDYIAGLLAGNVNVIPAPSADELESYTDQVRANMGSLDDQMPSSSDVADITNNALKKIKHVVYIIRENRTYDQVLGDLGRGNGDPSLVIFGKSTTPNAHQLVDDFVLMDNLYCNGEVSEDGHQWCNAAYATDFTEKAWVNSYSGREEAEADDRLTASPAGYLWDACRKKGLDYYSYGEFASFKSDPTSAPKFTGTKGLDGHASAEWSEAGGRTKKSGRDYVRCDVFIDDLKKAEETGKWPNYMVMSLGEDHTSGLRGGAYTPWASVASNDLAVGKIVDAVSHSKFWKETAIFVIEDDAQNGSDHVDAHRTVGMVISPYVKRGSLDSTLYTTCSMVRTMEIILGLDPMTQFDQKATPMYRVFTTKPDLTPYTAIQATADLEAKNPTKGKLVEMSNKLDWSGYDRADPDTLNYILWAAAKPGQAMPAPVRSSVRR